MKRKFVILILLLALATLILASLTSGWFHAEKTLAPSVQKTETASVSSPEKPVVAAVSDRAILSSTSVQSVGSPAETHPQTVEELQALAMKDDADSLKSILAALTNSDPQIREAARDAAVQFGDRAAAPALRAGPIKLKTRRKKSPCERRRIFWSCRLWRFIRLRTGLLPGVCRNDYLRPLPKSSLVVAAVCDRRGFEGISQTTAFTERRHRTLAGISIC